MIKRVVFLVSSGGGTLKHVHARQDDLGVIVVGVIGDRECGAVEYARKMTIDHIVVNFNEQGDLIKTLNRMNPDVVITTCWRILKPEVLSLPIEFINIHYSLLPAYRGVIGLKYLPEGRQRGERFTGTTLHRVTNDIDAGMILAQAVFRNTETCNEVIFKTGCLLLNQWFIDSLKGDFQVLINDHQVWVSITENFDNKGEINR